MTQGCGQPPIAPIRPHSASDGESRSWGELQHGEEHLPCAMRHTLRYTTGGTLPRGTPPRLSSVSGGLPPQTTLASERPTAQ
jgi:hypothetical protein